jgi:hypothetical protein
LESSQTTELLIAGDDLGLVRELQAIRQGYLLIAAATFG